MKIQPTKTDEYINNINKESHIKALLLYGPDSGLVLLRSKEVIKKLNTDPLNTISISEEQLKENSSIIFDEFLSISLFGDKKLILIKNTNNSISKTLEDIFATEPKGNNFILITAGNLDNKSSLRKIAENSSYIATIPCYADDDKTITKIIHQKLKEYGFKYTTDVANELTNNFGGNRLTIINELQKLNSYKGNNKNLTIEDISKCVKDTSENNINDLINEFTNLNINSTNKILGKLFSEAIYPIAIIRSFITYFLKLQLLQYQIQQGKTFQAITQEYRIFWKQAPIIKYHLNLWSSKKINHFLDKLIEIEVKCKTTGCFAELELSNFLLKAILNYKKK